MKKIISLILGSILALTWSLSAFAAEKAADIFKDKATKLPSIIVIIFFIFSS